LGKVLVKTSFGDSPIPFSECPTGGLDKFARATTMARHYENERVFLPKYSDWVPDYTKQLIKFPRDKHDEFVDITSMASKMETGLTFAEILARRA
jgi:predicted phage terminase large subunit-like protein